MECLNESEEDSGKRVFRPWQSRLDKNSSDCVTSDCDAELLFNIPFTGNIKLKVSHVEYVVKKLLLIQFASLTILSNVLNLSHISGPHHYRRGR